MASPPTTVAPGIDALAGAVDGDHVDALGDELVDDVAADLAGAEDDVLAHDWISLRLRAKGRTRVSAATVMAPLEPKTVNCLSTSMPTAVVIAQPAAQAAVRKAGQARARRPRRGRRTTAWARPTTSPVTAPWVTRAESVGVVVDERGPEPEPDHQPEGGGHDPGGDGRAVAAESPGLDGAEDGAGDQAAEQRGEQAVDPAGDQVAGVAADREAGEGHHPAAGGAGGQGAAGAGRVRWSGRRAWSLLGVGAGGAGVLGGDPGSQEAVRVVDEVVADEGVEQVGVPGEVGTRDGDELAVPGGPGATAADARRARPGGRASSPATSRRMRVVVVVHGTTVAGPLTMR